MPRQRFYRPTRLEGSPNEDGWKSLPASNPQALSSSGDAQSSIDDIDEVLNANKTAGELARNEQAAGEARPSNDDVKELEETPNTFGYDESQTKPSATEKVSFRGRFASRKNLLTTVGVAGGAGIAIAIMLSILPLKLGMFIDNIGKEAAKVPAYAVNQRVNYLVTRTVATRLLMISDANVDGNLLFCKSGAVGCSLFKTYTTNFIEKKYNLKFTKVANGVEIRVVTDGRTSLGGNGQSWRIEGTRIGGVSPEDRVTRVIRELNNTGMKRYIEAKVATSMDGGGLRGVLNRYLARKVLMKKYGVTHWRGFERTQAKVADVKTTMRAKILSNTVGKVTPRLALYMACLQQTATCAKSLNTMSSTPEDLAKLEEDVKNANTDEERERAQVRLEKAKAQNLALEKIKGVSMGEIDGDGSKLFSKIVAKGGAGLAIAGFIDMFFKALGAVDDGAIDTISQDMIGTAYAGFAFGDETGVVPNYERAKFGYSDLEVLGVYSDAFNGAEQTPLFAMESGVKRYNSSDTATVNCDGPDGKTEPTTLPKGELVCSNQKYNRNLTELIRVTPQWQQMATMAHAWNNTIGVGFDILGGLIGSALSLIPGFDKLTNAVGDLVKPLLAWMLDFVMSPPALGLAAPGSNNYVALSGALRNEQMDTMKYGVDESGKAMGGGGAVLTDAQVASIYQTSTNIANEQKSNLPALSRMFSPSVTGSLTQKLTIALPTSVSQFAGSPSAIVGMALHSGGSSVQAASSTAANPLGLINYGYASQTELEADPSKYTPESCAASAQAREDSFNKVDQYSVAVYTKTDPCALEKMVVGILLNDAEVTGDEYSLEDPDDGTGSAASGSSTGSTTFNVADLEKPVACPLDPTVKDLGTVQSLYTGDIITVKRPTIRLCQLALITGNGNDTSGATTNAGAVINAGAATQFLELAKAAKQDGIALRATSSFRLADSCGGTGDGTDCARPGMSNHQLGIGIDFALIDGDKSGSVTDCSGRSTSNDPVWKWLNQNAPGFGVKQYSHENWHWDVATSLPNRCPR